MRDSTGMASCAGRLGMALEKYNACFEVAICDLKIYWGFGLRLQFATSRFAGLLFEVTICDLKHPASQQLGGHCSAGEGARATRIAADIR